MPRRFRRWPRLRPLLVIVLAAALIIWAVAHGSNARGIRLGSFSTTNAVARAEPCEVLEVVDGATLLIRQPAHDQQPEFIGKVRLLGIAPPAPEHADDAMELLQKMTASPYVRLELDKRRIDPAGNFLAYVYAGNSHLSEALVEQGLARVVTYPGDSMSIERQLFRAQDQARVKQIGIWKR